MKLKTLGQIKNLKGKKVLVRVGFDVPMKNGRIVDDLRIQFALPTIYYLIKKKAKVILISHLGRPNGRKNKKYSLKPIYKNLGTRSSKMKKVGFVNDCIGSTVKEAIDKMEAGDVILLENLRFHSEEEKNDLKFAQSLADLADFYINDAFSVCHRRHASIDVITNYLPSAAGLLLEQEVKNLSLVWQNPKHPLIAVMGGVKISTKIGVMKNLIKLADHILIGGALANNFLKADGAQISKSIYEPAMIKTVKKLVKNKKIVLPLDGRIRFIDSNQSLTTKINELSLLKKDFELLDIGPETIRLFSTYLKTAKLIIWNGPLGYFEDQRFSLGTRQIAREIFKHKKAKIIIGGGETLAAIKKFKVYNFHSLAKDNIFISTGGGAMLEFLSGAMLPGITPLIK
ncbi:phosphoglycerate kinase [Patescibacteria group bacterium]|nr:phosphoglycerate kinase [Patescibacteria group bacterium]